MTISIKDYFLGPLDQNRDFLLNGGVIKTMRFELDTYSGTARYKLRDFNPGGVWNSDWLLRIENDGSITEYGDQYPPAKLDWPREKATLIFDGGHEIRWAEDAHGTLRPNILKSSPSKYGSFGTFLCKAMLQPDASGNITDDSVLNIYMEQKFSRTDRSMYHCRKGYGIFAITYYADSGVSQTITAPDAPVPPPPPAVA